MAPGVFAIYEPHQAEEVISYLILGTRQAMLFDTGMGISDIQKVTAELTELPIVVLNSHTHLDHVGGNWQFKDVLGMDTDFTRARAKGTTAGAQDEISPDMICGALPKSFDARSYATRPWTITRWIHDGDRLDLGDRVLEILPTPPPCSDSPRSRPSSRRFWARTTCRSQRPRSCPGSPALSARFGRGEPG